MKARRAQLVIGLVGLGLTLVAAIRYSRIGQLLRTRRQQEYLEQRADSLITRTYRHGRELWIRGDSASLSRAIGLFREVLDRDPRYAKAYAGRAAAYLGLGCAGYRQPDDA